MVLVLALLGCGPDVPLEGVWNGDIYYGTVNGQPYQRHWGLASRFDGDGADLQWRLLGDVYEPRVRNRPFRLRAEWSDTWSGPDFDAEQVHRVEMDEHDGERMSGTHTYSVTYRSFAGETMNEYVYEGTIDVYRTDRHDDAEADGLALAGEHGDFDADGLPINVRVRDGIAWLPRYQDGLRILDASDPAAIVEIGHVPVRVGDGEIWNDVKLLDADGKRYALMASSSEGLVIVDGTDPSAAEVVASWPPQGDWSVYDVHTVWVDEAARIAYLGYVGREVDGEWIWGGLEIVDLTNPTKPVGRGSWAASDAGGDLVHDLMVRDGVAYLCAWDAGLVMVDVSVPEEPVVIGQYDDYDRRTSHSVWVGEIGGRLIAVHGDEDFGAHLRVLDVTDPANVQLLAEWETRPQVSIHNVMLVGDRAYVAYYQDGVRVIDLSDPTRPEQVAYYNTWDPDRPDVGWSFFEGAVGIDVAEGRVWVADSHRGLVVLEED